MSLPYRFDRYRNGRLMAEGIKVNKENCLEDAIRVAARLADHGDVLVYDVALEARVAAADKLAELLKEARVDLAGYVAADWPEDLRAKYPTYENKHRRDMALCWQIDAALAAYQATKEGE
jgi:hypothetical protein